MTSKIKKYNVGVDLQTASLTPSDINSLDDIKYPYTDAVAEKLHVNIITMNESDIEFDLVGVEV